MFAEKPMEGQPWDVVIVGSGPSALTAAIYTTRGAASTLVIAGEVWGGQLMLTTEVDNFPGFPQGINGPQLMQNMRQQAERFGAEIIEKNATKLDVSQSPYRIFSGEQSYIAKSVIVATGAQTKWLGVPGEEKLIGMGVSSCAPCDAPFFKDKEVVVVGGGDSAMEEALVLTKYATLVTIVHRKNEFRASAAMQKRVFDNEKIKIIWDSEVVEMHGENKLEEITIKTLKNSSQIGKPTEINKLNEDENYIYWKKPTNGVFVAIGHVPASGPFKEILTVDQKGYVVPEPKNGFMTSTNIEGVFVAGDVHDTSYRQAITAAGFGCMAGMEVLKHLDKETPSW